IRGGGTTHYLLGSVHLLPETAQPLPSGLERAYREADSLVFETDLEALGSAEMQQQLLAAAAGRPLREMPAPSLHAAVQARASELGLGAAVCDPYAAWFCAMLLELAEFRRGGFTAEHGIDQV